MTVPGAGPSVIPGAVVPRWFFISNSRDSVKLGCDLIERTMKAGGG